MPNVTPTVERALMKERGELQAAAQRLKAQLEAQMAQIAEIDAFLRPQTEISYGAPELGEIPHPESPAGLAMSAREVNRKAIEVVTEVLLETQQMKTSDLFVALHQRGVTLPAKNPEERLSQLLSAKKDTFQSDRKNGWSLKGDVNSSALDAEAEDDDL